MLLSQRSMLACVQQGIKPSAANVTAAAPRRLAKAASKQVCHAPIFDPHCIRQLMYH
jgi:hypothetical protein